ncbi:MAG: hypothetical protein M3376_11245 [Actinomycetota bacterium]|nr:hypothetical protein [Actinomycetota bacterium]
MGEVELEAAAALYSAATLEQLDPFALVDRLVELWMRGGVPTGATTSTSRRLDRYWLHREERLSDEERRTVYERVFGQEFDERWAALLAALAQSEADADAGARAADVRAVLNAGVDESILLAAPPLIAQLRGALEILDDPEILLAYGAQDIWQLVDTLARMQLGRDFDVVRARTMAAAGTLVVGWLAEEVDAVPEEVADAAAVWLSAAARPPAD